VSTVSVHVQIAGETIHAGTLFSHRRRGTESSTFSYDNGYLALPGAYALDPALPLVAAPAQTEVNLKIFRAFGDCAPDTWGRRLILRREAALARQEGRGPRGLGEIDYLLGVRDDLRQGALRFRGGDGDRTSEFVAVASEGVPLLTDISTLLALAERAEHDTADLPDLERLIQAGGSLGGARPKAHVRQNNGRLAIAKFPSSDQDTWNVMAWEKVAFDLAREAGIELPHSELYRMVGRCVHIINRFDRAERGQRIGYVSALTMLEAFDGDERSYLEIVDVIERTSDEATNDLRQLWRRILFSV
jgi:serine/threonine-protein kinase HipA